MSDDEVETGRRKLLADQFHTCLTLSGKHIRFFLQVNEASTAVEQYQQLKTMPGQTEKNFRLSLETLVN